MPTAHEWYCPPSTSVARRVAPAADASAVNVNSVEMLPSGEPGSQPVPPPGQGDHQSMVALGAARPVSRSTAAPSTSRRSHSLTVP